MNRILRNPDGTIDEIVAEGDQLVHIEQMSDNEWSVGIYLPDGGHWTGAFVSACPMRFFEHGSDFEWDQDSTHPEETT